MIKAEHIWAFFAGACVANLLGNDFTSLPVWVFWVAFAFYTWMFFVDRVANRQKTAFQYDGKCVKLDALRVTIAVLFADGRGLSASIVEMATDELEARRERETEE